VFGEEFRVVYLTRDKVPDDLRHSVYRGNVIGGVLDLVKRSKRTLGIEEDGVFHKVRPLKHAPQFRNLLLSIWSHYTDKMSAHDNLEPPPSPTLTLLVVTDQHHLPQRRLVPGQHWQVIPNLDLTRFIDDQGLDWDELRKPALHDPVRRQHADRAKHDPRSRYQSFVLYCGLLKF
jgi:hypothetical protein